jgi:hypothetical protein
MKAILNDKPLANVDGLYVLVLQGTVGMVQTLFLFKNATW